jgi:hypothetical protein
MEFKAVSVSDKEKLSELAEEALVQTEEKKERRDPEDLCGRPTERALKGL